MELLKYTIDLTGSSYINFTIEGGDSNWNIGDQVWFSEDGTEMEIDELALEDEEIKSELEENIGEDTMDEILKVLKRVTSIEY